MHILDVSSLFSNIAALASAAVIHETLDYW